MRVLAAITTLVFCGHCFGRMTVALTPSQLGPYPVGTPVTWTARVTDAQSGAIDYQFSGGPLTKGQRVLRTFHRSNRLIWAPMEVEGDYSVKVTARDRSTGEVATDQLRFHLVSLVTNGQPVITPTSNPLVALYSAPGCDAGGYMYVEFGTETGHSDTNAAPCTPGSTMNFYIAGMLPSTTYNMFYVVVPSSGASVAVPSVGPTGQFTTGTIDSTLSFPVLDRLVLPSAAASTGQGILLMDFLSSPVPGPYYFPTAVDLEGRIVWYYANLANAAQDTNYFIRPIPASQGHMLLFANDPSIYPDQGQLLLEIDPAGNTVSQTSASQVSEQLLSQGKVGITGFNHDAIRLPNGHTIVICSQEKMYPPGTQGSTGVVDILGDALVDLDANWQVAWSWSAFDHLDVSRKAILGETCYGQAGCPDLVLATKANDWLHSNSVQYLPGSGDLLFSIRHQDWVVKINYQNGNGSGNVVWRLGPGGDFSMNSSDPYPWQTHQHDAQLDEATGTFSTFDNGNTRVANAGGVGHSRGYVLQIDENARTATPTMLADMGVYSVAVGSAQPLDNGNYHFNAGFVPTPTPQAFSVEVAPDGTVLYNLQAFVQVYRSYRMNSLYSQN